MISFQGEKSVILENHSPGSEMGRDKSRWGRETTGINNHRKWKGSGFKIDGNFDGIDPFSHRAVVRDCSINL